LFLGEGPDFGESEKGGRVEGVQCKKYTAGVRTKELPSRERTTVTKTSAMAPRHRPEKEKRGRGGGKKG